MTQIIAFLGKGRSGKDTCGDYIIKHHQFVKYSFADPIKKALKSIFLFNDEQLYGNKKEEIDERWNVSPREVMQCFGTELGQYAFMEMMPGLNKTVKERCFWVKCFELWKKEHPTTPIVITDVRFLHEIETLLEMNATIIYITRNTETNVRQHSSEEYIPLYQEKTHYTIENTGTLEDLYNKIDCIMNNICVR